MRKQNAKVVDLKAFQTQKLLRNSLCFERRPLYLSYGTTKIGLADDNGGAINDFTNYISSIKSNIEQIQTLMQELAKLN